MNLVFKNIGFDGERQRYEWNPLKRGCHWCSRNNATGFLGQPQENGDVVVSFCCFDCEKDRLAQSPKQLIPLDWESTYHLWEVVKVLDQ